MSIETAYLTAYGWTFQRVGAEGSVTLSVEAGVRNSQIVLRGRSQLLARIIYTNILDNKDMFSSNLLTFNYFKGPLIEKSANFYQG